MLLVLLLLFRTGRSNLLLPIKTNDPSSALLTALIDTIRRFVLLDPLIVFEVGPCSMCYDLSYAWCFYV